MTGTGTQSDPYIVDNWADFQTISTTDNIYVEWDKNAGNKVIDFNDIQPSGYTETVYFPRNVNFNGWTLKNFHSTATYAINSGSPSRTVRNLILDNFYISCAAMSHLFSNTNLYNCTISGIAQSGSDAEIFSTSNVNCCAVNVKVVSNGAFYLVMASTWSPYNDIRNSDVVLDVYASKIFLKNSSGTAYNNRFSGKLHSTGSDSVTLNGNNSSVYNLESNNPLYYTGNGISVYNSDLATSKGSSGTFKACTTEQLKDAEYLYSIGFPIGID